MDQVKSWLTSKTVWAAAIAALIQVLHAFNVHVGFLDSLDANVFAGHAADAATAAFSIAAAVFRVTATHKLA